MTLARDFPEGQMKSGKKTYLTAGRLPYTTKQPKSDKERNVPVRYTHTYVYTYTLITQGWIFVQEYETVYI